MLGITFRSLIHFEFIFIYGIRECSNLILLQTSVQFSQHHLLKRLSFLHFVVFPPVSYLGDHTCMRFISELFILFHCSIFLFLCQNYTILTNIALWYSLKSGNLISPAPFFLLKIAFALQGLLCFHANCRVFSFNSVKNAIGSLMGIALNW